MHSRRQFLKLSGIVLAGSGIGFQLPTTQAQEVLSHGRALSAIPVLIKPEPEARIISQLWPDSVTPIVDVRGDWFRLPDGYVQREGLQPMAAYDQRADTTVPDMPFWGEVSAPVAPIRGHCWAEAPLVTRIGHAGVMHIVDYLPGENGGWYAAADDSGTILGWSQAIYWQPILSEVDSTQVTRIEIDLNAQLLTAWADELVVLRAPCSTNGTAIPGKYGVLERKPNGIQGDSLSGAWHGVPWLTGFGDNFTLGGVYWHNSFGKPAPGMTVQVSPPVARWLFDGLGNSSHIVLI